MILYTFSRINVTIILLCMISMATYAQVTMTQKQRVIDIHKRAQIETESVNTSAVGKRFQLWRESNDVLTRHTGLAGVKELTIDQILAYDRLFADVPDLHITWDETGKVPISITGSPVQRSMCMAAKGEIQEKTTKEFFRRFAALLALNGSGENLTLVSAETEESGRTHLRFLQRRNSLPILGKEAICSLNSTGDMDLFMGRLVADDIAVTGSFHLTEHEAVSNAETHISSRLHGSDVSFHPALPWDNATLVQKAYAEKDNKLYAVFNIELRPTPFDRWQCIVNAENGTVLRAFNAVCYDGPTKGSATDLHSKTVTLDSYNFSGTHFLIDASRSMFNAASSVFPNSTVGTITTLNANNTDLQTLTHFTSTNNTWNDPSSVSAHYHAGVIYEYYKNTHGRNSSDNKGSNIISIVNVTMNGVSMDNAFWNGQFISYGNGGPDFDPWAKGLDMCAHEFTHSITEHTAGLEYLNQSGALNESFSDIFATMIDKDDWTIFEDAVKTRNTYPSGALRSLADPHNGAAPGSIAWQPKHMNEYVQVPEDYDNGGVHINSGIPNHAAYLLAMKLGRDKTERIMYNALTTKLTKQAKFIDFRLAIIQAAQQLYGNTEAQACAQACDQVGILDGKGTDNPVDYPPVNGSDRMLFVNTDPFMQASLWIATPPASAPNDFSSISFTDIWSKPGITDDGSIAVFVDTDHNIRAIALVGAPNEQVIDASGIWNSIAVSRDGNQLAVTAVLGGAMIYGFDLSGPTLLSHNFSIYTPTYSPTEVPNTAVLVDALSFSLDGQTLLFDVYNEIKIGAAVYGFWDINTLNFWNKKNNIFSNGRIERIFPQDPTINLGNPVWAETRPNVIAFDAQPLTNENAWVVTMDMTQRKPNFLVQIPPGTFGFPSFSGNDKIISVVETGARSTIYNIPMAADGVTASGNPVRFISDGTLPLWFRTGLRPLDVAAEAGRISEFTLEQNYPNPFNPTTHIRFVIPVRGLITLTIHDLLGRKVKTLLHEIVDEGSHSVVWDGRDTKGTSVSSGVYLYQLQYGNSIITRRMIVSQ